MGAVTLKGEERVKLEQASQRLKTWLHNFNPSDTSVTDVVEL